MGTDRKRIVILDMDGTLVDTQAGITAAVNGVRQAKGLGMITRESIVRAINDEAVNLALMFYETSEYDPRDKALFETLYWEECTRGAVVFAGVEAGLRTMRDAGLLMSVATNASTKFAEKILAYTGIDRFFDHCLGADAVGCSKPDPTILRTILDRYGHDAANDPRAVMIGDGIKDMKAAAAAGMFRVFAAWGYSSLDEGYDCRWEHPGYLGRAHTLFDKGVMR